MSVTPDTPKMADRESQIRMAVSRGKVEIAQDITDGFLPPTVRSFADLHDYMDANGYGGFSEGNLPDLQFIAEVHDQLDAWIRAGRPPDGSHEAA